jgi:hypothetical protein
MVDRYNKVVKIGKDAYGDVSRYLEENFMVTQIGYEGNGLEIRERLNEGELVIIGKNQNKINELELKLNEFNTNKK